MQHQSSLQKLESVDYNLGINKLLVIGALIFCFLVAFFIHFPIQRQVEGLVKTQLAQLPGCQMSFERLRIELFLPKIVLTEMRLPAHCFGGGQGMKLPYVNLYFRGPSFSPLGVAFKISTELHSQPLNLYYAAGISRQVIRVEENKLNLSLFSRISPQIPKLSGAANVEALMSLAGPRMDELKVSIESSNLNVPGQMMGDLKLPKIDIGNFSLKLESEDGKKVQLKELIIGGVNSSIRGKFTGNISLAPNAIAFSPISLKGEASFSAEFLEAFPILNLMLPQFTQVNNFYQINMTGTLGNMRPIQGQ